MTSTSTEVDFKAMGIYVETPTGDRVGNELREMQKEQGGDSTLMTPRDVYLASSMHYLNDEPLEQMNKLFNLEDGQAHRILDFGAGYAGDARIFANERTSVTCVEIQKHIHTQAQKLTDDLERSGTLCKNRVFHENIDITKPEHYLATTLTDTTNTDTGSDTTTEINSGKFDHAYSMLVILHIENRSAVFSSLKHHLKPGGDLYIEDFYAKGELSEQDKEQLAGPVACPYVPSKSRYLQDLEAAGFEDVHFTDMTSEWSAFVSKRFAAFQSNRQRHERVHGVAVVEDLHRFYSTVTALFQRGNLGGVRLTAKAKII